MAHTYETKYIDIAAQETDRDSNEEYLQSGDPLLGEVPSRTTLCHRWLPSLASVIIMLLLSLIGIVAIDLSHKPSNLECAKQLSMYSPAMEAVEYIDIDFAASFNSTNIYRGPPIPEREAAWLGITYKHGVEISVEEIQGLNRSESDHLRHVPPEIGTGYVGILEVFHQLHCLNMIRMYTWYQVDKFSGIPDGLSMSPLKNRMHIDHCIESLRISLMCAGDVTPLLIREGGPVGSKADFNTHHRCRNFEKLNDWIDNNWSVL